MRRFITSFAIALGCTAVAINAQETRTQTETRSSGGQPQVVTYSGCVQTGTQAKTFVLDKVVPVTKTTTTETPTSSTTVSSTSYVLVPGDTVQVQEHVGKKVEVTGMLIPGGNTRTETTTRTEREDAPDTKSRERTETRNAMPEFRVTSIKTIGNC
jgi:ribosome-associated protein YbcJ (S4-like RNA binding protein)